jgi:hypothetical protein
MCLTAPSSPQNTGLPGTAEAGSARRDGEAGLNSQPLLEVRFVGGLQQGVPDGATGGAQQRSRSPTWPNGPLVTS